jgi:hypothetical protein
VKVLKILPHLAFDYKTRNTNSIHETTNKTWHRWQQTWLIQCKRILHYEHSAKNNGSRTKFKCWECNIRLCAMPYITQNHISEYQLTLKWESITHKCQLILPMHLLNWFFSVAYSWWNYEGDWGVDFAEGGYEGTKTCQGGLYVRYMLHIPIWGKYKKHCLETSVSNTYILEKS